MILIASACNTARCSVPRGLESMTAARSLSFSFLLPSNATRSSAGASARCTISRSPARSIQTLSNRLVASNAFSAASRAASSKRPFGEAWKYERTVPVSMRRLPSTEMTSRARPSDSAATADMEIGPNAAISRTPAAINRRHRRIAILACPITPRLFPARPAPNEAPARGKRMSGLRSVAALSVNGLPQFRRGAGLPAPRIVA